MAFERDLYTLRGGDPWGAEPEDPYLVDRAFSGVERLLSSALDGLLGSSNGALDADQWGVVVQFVAALFVRAPEFAMRFEERLDRLFDTDRWRDRVPVSDNTNYARIFELQRLYAPVMRAEWRVLHFPPNFRGVTSDRGLSPMRTPHGALGYAIPLSTSAVLAVTYGPEGLDIVWDGHRWNVVGIEHHTVPRENASWLCEVLAQGCRAEVYGPTRSAVQQATADQSSWQVPAADPGPDLLVGPDAKLRDEETLLMKFTSLTGRPPSAEDPKWVSLTPPDRRRRPPPDAHRTD